MTRYTPGTPNPSPFALIKHTKENQFRRTAIARPAFCWIGSWDNYDARLQRRWPVRFFLSRTLYKATVGRFNRLMYRIRYGKRQGSTFAQYRFRAVLDSIVDKNARDGLSSSRMVFVFSRLGYEDVVPDILQGVSIDHSISYCQSVKHKWEMELVPRAGTGMKSILDYPEARRIDDMSDVIEHYDAKLNEITSKIEMVKKSKSSEDSVDLMTSKS